MAQAPGFTQWIPLPYGQFGAVLRDPLRYQLKIREQLGDVVRFDIGPLKVYFLYHPDHVRRVLQDRQKNYQRGWQYRMVEQLFGANLVTSDGEFWRRQRRLAQPAFHRDRLTNYATTMREATSRWLTRCREHAGQPMDITPEMSHLAMDIAGRTLFSRDVHTEADIVGSEFAVVSRWLAERFNKPFATFPPWVPTAANRRFKQARQALNEVVLGYIRERRQDGLDRGDLLSMLLEARDEETGEQMTDDQVRAEALTFLIAGHETTATALTWTWFLLASHPDIQQRVRDEVQAVLGDQPPSLETVPRLSFTRMVIEESMRLYPPVWAVSREAVVEDEIDGFRIPAGAVIVLCSYVTHRHPAGWEQPDQFQPDRFAPEQSAGRPKGSYFPFLMGPHQCIGHEFAMLEMRLIVAMALQQFSVRLLPDQDIQPQASLVLRPSRPVQLTWRSLDR